MLLEPSSDRGHGAFVGLRRWVRPMEDAHLAEEHDRHATAFALTGFGAQHLQQCFNVLPGEVGAGGVCEDGGQRLLVRAFHGRMVPKDSTVCKATAFYPRAFERGAGSAEPHAYHPRPCRLPTTLNTLAVLGRARVVSGEELRWSTA